MAEPVVSLPTPEGLASLLGLGSDVDFTPIASASLQAVTAMARSYTRGGGFGPDAGQVKEDISAVVLTAAARYASNPEQFKREEWDGYSVTPTPFLGWSLVELAVLNRYRRRAQ